SLLIATTEGSLSTIPLFFIYTSTLAVPKSIPTSLAISILLFFKIFIPYCPAAPTDRRKRTPLLAAFFSPTGQDRGSLSHLYLCKLKAYIVFTQMGKIYHNNPLRRPDCGIISIFCVLSQFVNRCVRTLYHG